ncbi:hypothetical protein NDU88_005296 [Pleurodeles waltl]|uniref:Uncharacterized protein n=1 Tax=Pleurodeles waltl TaxID=8319 RepID=A0AAV7WY47_PLEWA|nr:hypothetical protein NDU88_005296 [Pleurodeles waltl]
MLLGQDRTGQGPATLKGRAGVMQRRRPPQTEHGDSLISDHPIWSPWQKKEATVKRPAWEFSGWRMFSIFYQMGYPTSDIMCFLEPCDQHMRKLFRRTFKGKVLA